MDVSVFFVEESPPPESDFDSDFDESPPLPPSSEAAPPRRFLP